MPDQKLTSLEKGTDMLDNYDDYDFLIVDDDKRPDKNPWREEVPNINSSDAELKKEIEDIMKAAEEAKRAAQIQQFVEEIPVSTLPTIEKPQEADTTIVSKEEEKVNKEEKINDEEESAWKNFVNSKPVTALTYIAKEMVIPMSVFTVVSFLTLQFAEG